MGILDDAIREHLDLKRKHGARDAELREIEDEAFGSGDRAGSLRGGRALQRGAPTRCDAGNEEPKRLVDAEVLRPTAGRPQAPPSARPEPESLG